MPLLPPVARSLLWVQFLIGSSEHPTVNFRRVSLSYALARREGLDEATQSEVPHQPHDVGKLAVRHLRTDPVGHRLARRGLDLHPLQQEPGDP